MHSTLELNSPQAQVDLRRSLPTFETRQQAVMIDVYNILFDMITLYVI